MPKKAPTRVLLVDDQSIILDGLAALLQDDPEFKVVGVARSGEEAIVSTMQHLPDVVVMDISMPPGMDGIEATARIKKAVPRTRVLVLSMYHQREMVAEVLEADRFVAASELLLDMKDHPRRIPKLRRVGSVLRHIQGLSNPDNCGRRSSLTNNACGGVVKQRAGLCALQGSRTFAGGGGQLCSELARDNRPSAL